MPVLLNDWLLAFSARGPVSATVRLCVDAAVTMSTNCSTSAFEMLLGSLSKLTWSQPTVRSALTFVMSTRLPASS